MSEAHSKRVCKGEKDFITKPLAETNCSMRLDKVHKNAPSSKGIKQRATFVASLLASSGLCLPANAQWSFSNFINPSASALLQETPIVKAAADDQALFEADTVTQDGASGLIIATGDVKAFFGDQTLEAERVEYDQAKDVVTAKGNVSITDTNGQVFYASGVVLSGDLADGIATEFASILEDGSRLAGTTVIKRNNGNNQLNNAAYTGCIVCEDAEGDDAPTWQIKAQQITQDKSTNTISFQNAWVEIFGAPIIFTPYLRVPDPTVERQAGFLVPKFGQSDRLGGYLETPYYLPISDSQDITFSPKFMTDRGILLQGEHRIRTSNGYFTTQAGIISGDGEDSVNIGDVDVPVEVPNTRYHFFGKGRQEFRENWAFEYDIDKVSDKVYLRNLDVEPEGDLEDDVGVFRPDRLRSNARAVFRNTNSYFAVEGFTFQTLRVNENDDFTGIAVPRISYERVLDTPFLKGKTTLSSNLLYLTRPEGLSSARAIANATWERGFTSKGGHRFTLFGDLRLDAYHYDDILDGTENCNPTVFDYPACTAFLPGDGLEDSKISTRALPTLGAEWSFPLAKQTDNATIIIEPKIQVVASPNTSFGNDFLDEDSQFFEFDTTTLFDWKKASGYDLWEDGQRINVGIASTVRLDNGISIKSSLGQQFRADETTTFSNLSGLNRKISDYVGAFDIDFGPNFAIENRFRYDQNDKELRRSENRLRGQIGPVSGAISYLKLSDTDPFIDQPEANNTRDQQDIEFLNVSANYNINENFFVGAQLRQDLNAVVRDRAGNAIRDDQGGLQFDSIPIERILSIGYKDECTRLSILFRDDQTRTGISDSDQQISVQLELGNFR